MNHIFNQTGNMIKFKRENYYTLGYVAEEKGHRIGIRTRSDLAILTHEKAEGKPCDLYRHGSASL